MLPRKPFISIMAGTPEGHNSMIEAEPEVLSKFCGNFLEICMMPRDAKSKSEVAMSNAIGDSRSISDGLW